jgi:methanogenic corrinoid protein MtbC1
MVNKSNKKSNSYSDEYEQSFEQLFAIIEQRLKIELKFSLSSLKSQQEIEQFCFILRDFGLLLHVVYRYNAEYLLDSEIQRYLLYLKSRNLPLKLATFLIDSWLLAIQGILKPPECDILSQPLTEIGKRFDRILDVSISKINNESNPKISELADFLMKSDINNLRELFLKRISDARTAKKFISEYLLPAVSNIGDYWLSNKITIAEEHLATETAMQVLSELNLLAPPKSSKPFCALITCVPGEYHSLPVKALSVFLELSGWRTIVPGQSMPSEEIVNLAIKEKPKTVLLSMTLASRLPETLFLVQRLLSQENFRPDIIVGGGGIIEVIEILKQHGLQVARTFEEAEHIASAY